MGWRTYFIGLSLNSYLSRHRGNFNESPSTKSTRPYCSELADRVVWSQKIKKVKIFFPTSKSYSIDPSNAIPRLPNSTSTNYNKDFTIRFAFTGFNAILYGIFIYIYKSIFVLFMCKNVSKAIIFVVVLLLVLCSVLWVCSRSLRWVRWCFTHIEWLVLFDVWVQREQHRIFYT